MNTEYYHQFKHSIEDYNKALNSARCSDMLIMADRVSPKGSRTSFVAVCVTEHSEHYGKTFLVADSLRRAMAETVVQERPIYRFEEFATYEIREVEVNQTYELGIWWLTVSWEKNVTEDTWERPTVTLERRITQ